MRETALDTLDRNRNTFLKSIADNIGKSDAGADFFLSAVSAERKGYILSNRDNSLIKTFYSILKQDEEYPKNVGEYWGVMDKDSPAGNIGTMGGQLIQGSSYDLDRVVQPQPNQSLAGMNVNFAQGDANDPYKNHNPLDHRFNGLMSRSQSTGVPAMIDNTLDFYRPPSVGADPRSLVDGQKERAWDDYYGDDENHAFVLNHHHYHKLPGEGIESTQHHDYEKHFNNWKTSNADLEIQLKEQGYSDMEAEHEMRLRHLDEAKDRWTSGDKDESGIPHGLGLFDYLFGLEWKSPSQRQEIYKHMQDWGLGDKHRTSIGSDNHTHVGRLIRNFQQRFAGLHDHWVRSPIHPGQPVEFVPQPVGKPVIRPTLNKEALDHIGGFDKAMDWHSGMQPERPDSQKISIVDGKLQFGGAGALTNGLRRGELFRLMNIDPATEELYRDGEHPDYENWNSKDPSNPFTQEDVDKVLQYLENANTSDDFGVMAENAGMFHYGHHISPSHYPESITQGENSTLATHWNQPFVGGGLGKHQNDLFAILHEASLLYGPDNLSNLMSEMPEELEGYDKYFAELERANQEPDVPKELKPTMGPRSQRRSLLFDKYGDDAIGIRHYIDTEGEKLSNGMLNAMAPFGQPESEIVTGKETATQKRGYTVVRGDASNAETNQHPHNKFMSSKLGTRRRNWERHFGSVNPSIDNINRKELFDAYGDNKAWNKLQQTISGMLSGTMGGHNPFMGKGGAADSTSAQRKMAHIYHRIGTMMHMAGSPFSRDNGIRPLGQQEGSDPTAANIEAIDSLRMGRQVGMGRVQPDEDMEGEKAAATSEELMNHLFDKARFIEDKMNDPDLSEKHKSHLLHQLGEINSELDDLEAQGLQEYEGTGADIGDRQHQTHGPTEFSKLRADHEAISQAGNQIQNTILGNNPELWSQLFDESLPIEVLDANKRMLARMSNDYLHIAPHDSHGITTQGLGKHMVETKMAGQGNPNKVKASVHNSRNKINVNTSGEQVAEMLGMDYNNERQKATIDSLLEKVASKTNDPNLEFPIMTVEQLLSSTEHYGDLGQGLSERANRINTKRSFKTHESIVNAANRIRRELAPVTGKSRTTKLGVEEGMAALGLDYHVAHNPDPSAELSTQPTTAGGQAKFTSRRFRTLQDLSSILISDPNVEPQELESIMAQQLGLGDVKVDAFGPNAEGTVHSLYNSSGFSHEFGDQHDEDLNHVMPTFDYKINKDGTFEIYHVPEGMPMNLVRPLSQFIDAALPHLSHIQGDESRIGSLNSLTRQGPQFQPNEGAELYQRKLDNMTVGKSKIGLADLTNPDIIRKELGKDVPILQPMHRIFKLEDLEHLRGFTGDWVVSIMPQGERGFVTKEDDKVSCSAFTLSEEDKENFKKVTDNDYHVDVIKLEEGYYIFDVIKYDGKEVHDTLLDDRIKILRGGMEGIEDIHVPSASDTRLTDDGGLELTVKDLEKEGKDILLRDAKSTYMVGELRQPKWVLLSEGNDVVLIVLERRGNGPYTYRLGTGPITQDDNLGDRAVTLNKETYMDVGTAFNSEEKYNEGDHVRVNVDNVGVSEFSEGNKLYTVTGSEIEGEAEGEGLVSQETLDLLTKSESSQWICEVSSTPYGIRISMPQGDVVYKATESGSSWTVHSPVADNNYLVRLSESQRRFWSPVAGTMLKAGLEIAAKEEVNEDDYEEGPIKPLIKPKRIKDTDWWEEEKRKVLVKGLQLVEKLLKSGVGAVGQSSTGTMGLGIGYATPIESPMGPTNLHDEKTMPDYDNKKRPGEDSPIEPESEEEESSKHIVIPVEGGKLELTNDSAVLRT